MLDGSWKYEDVIVEDFIDTYFNLTLKSMMLLNWMKFNYPTVRYIVDDDMYLNVENVFKIVNSEESVTMNALLGKLYHRAARSTIGLEMVRNVYL